MRRMILFVLFLGEIILPSHAQKIEIKEIRLEGLKKTRHYILMREIDFHPGDSIELKDIVSRFKTNEKRILNTNLVVSAIFNLIDLNLEKHSGSVRITCKEGLYIYPAPLLEFLDNDFNKWWNNYHRSLKTLSYGAYFQHINLTGNGDPLKLYAQAGFTKKISLDYEFPYLNQANTLGIGITTFFSANREVAIKTTNNYLLFKNSVDADLLRRTKLGLSLIYRPGIYSKHRLEINNYLFKASDSLAFHYNQDYFNGAPRLLFTEISYSFTHDTRDMVPYAMKGWLIGAYIDQLGMGGQSIHKSDIGARISNYKKISKKLSYEEHIFLRYNLDRRKIPYYFNKALGYEDLYVRGYDYQVIDGQDYFLSKGILRFCIFEKNLDWGKWMFLRSYQRMPLDIYLTGGFDIAQVWDRFYAQGNPLTNKLINGYGIGLDIVFYYNKLLRLEVSKNSNGSTGFFIHFDAGL